MNPFIIILLLVVNIPVYKIIGSWIFEDKEDFLEAIKFKLIPDIVSLFRGKFANDFFAEMKLSFFIFACIIVIAIEYFIISGLFNL